MPAEAKIHGDMGCENHYTIFIDIVIANLPY